MSRAAAAAASDSALETPLGFRNKLINGCLDFWQRATSFTPIAATVTYTADRWSVLRATVNYTVARVAGTTARYAMKVQRTAAASDTGAIILTQVLETGDSIPLAGKTVTLSATVKAGADFSAASLAVIVRTATGTDEGMTTSGLFTTGDAATLSTTQVITTTATRYYWKAAIPAGKTQLAVQFRFTPVGTAGADDSFTIEDVQLEEGDDMTAFERRPLGLELALCQRYYEVGSFGVTAYQAAATSVALHQRFGVTKRAVPAVVDSSPSYANSSGIVVTGIAEYGFTHYAIWTALGPGSYGGLYAASAEL